MQSDINVLGEIEIQVIATLVGAAIVALVGWSWRVTSRVQALESHESDWVPKVGTADAPGFAKLTERVRDLETDHVRRERIAKMETVQEHLQGTVTTMMEEGRQAHNRLEQRIAEVVQKLDEVKEDRALHERLISAISEQNTQVREFLRRNST